MKRNIIIILTIFFYSTGFAQIHDTYTYNDLIKSGLLIRTIEGFPSDRLPENSSQALLAIKDSKKSYDVSLFFLTNDSLLINASHLEITNETIFKCNKPDVTYETEFIKLECRESLTSKLFITELGVKDNRLSFKTSYIDDLNSYVYELAELAIKEDDPVAYCEAYMGAQYYNSYYYRMKEALEWAHKKALQFYKNKDYQSAASLMLDLEQRCNMSIDLYDTMGDEYIMGNDFIRIWSDVTLFYLKAEMNEQCVELSKKIIEIDPNIVGVYLQYGDALFNLDEKEESKSIYNKYIDLMIKNNKKDKIPTRVYERTK